MKLYALVIKPRGPFGTPLKGDTLFGHFCWQAYYDEELLKGGLDHWIDRYAEQPFAVFSSAWPKLASHGGRYALKRPDLPLHWLFPDHGDRAAAIRERKKKASRKWLLVKEDLRIDLREENLVDEEALIGKTEGEWTASTRRSMRGKDKKRLSRHRPQPHNTINRLTMTTGTGMFAPYVMPTAFFLPEMEWVVFVLLDEEATDAERIRTGMERIGRQGFGRDASTGMGRFDLGGLEEKSLPAVAGANALYTLAPSLPEANTYRDCLFSPFTRFGKHGDFLATSGNPFKCPIMMADEGAVLIPKDGRNPKRPYLGRAVRHISKREPRAVAQGYAPVIPFKLEKIP